MGWCIIAKKTTHTVSTQEVINAISEETGLDQKESTRLLGIILGTIVKGVAEDGKIYLGKLGKIYLGKPQFEKIQGLKNQAGRTTIPIRYRPHLHFKQMMKSLSALWH